MLHITVTEGAAYPVTLTQISTFRYTVIYGEHIVQGLLLANALNEFSECVLHSADCAS